MHLETERIPSQGSQIISRAEAVGLDTSVLYEAVIDLSAEGLVTAGCINMAAGILLNDLGLPNYFFKNIEKDSLKNILASIATSIRFKDGEATLYGLVAHVDFSLERNKDVQRIRIATEETRDAMEKVLGDLIAGHRREYYHSPKSHYHTYIISPGTVSDYPAEAFRDSQFLFSLSDDFTTTVEATRMRYENFLNHSADSVTPLIEVFNLTETEETRIMFKSDFGVSQLPVIRRLIREHGLTLRRAYWEPYRCTTGVPSSICSLYIQGGVTRKMEAQLVNDLLAYLSFRVSPVIELYEHGTLNFHEMLFAGNVIDFTRLFIYREKDNPIDREILDSLESKDLRDTFSRRVHNSNKSTYTSSVISTVATANPDLIKFLYKIFDRKFNPAVRDRITNEELDEKFKEFNRIITSRFIDFPYGYDIFKFMFKIITATLKTNFYKEEKRSYAFRFDNSVLDPLVFDQFVYGIFFVNGHYASGTHLRAADIARGGLRLIRVTEANHARELDNAVLLNYALGPKAQRMKHKDICESGSKGVVIPHPMYARYHLDSLHDYSEGIMDLILGDERVLDLHGKPEMIFFGPDEGTAPLMDAISNHARERGYRFWRTITTGKATGIPHDTYGILENGDLFGLFDSGGLGTELQINGERKVLTTVMEDIHERIGGQIRTSGMTTTCVMASFRTLINHYGAQEEELNLMMTGGPDGDLGANQIQCYRGKICLVIDGGSILFDPEGLDKKELRKIAFMRYTSPRANTLAFPVDRLSSKGFRVELGARNIRLPDGTMIEDGTVFHRDFLTEPENRRFIAAAGISAFIPCGGFKDTINRTNVKQFLNLFQELRYIVEGANVFFDDASRRYIANATAIKQIKDSTANKGGVYSSSVSEVLTAFLLGDSYEEKLLNDRETRWALIQDIMAQVEAYSKAETAMLLKLHDRDPSLPLFVLSETTSEQIFSLQTLFEEQLDPLLADEDLVWQVLTAYIPPVLVNLLGRTKILHILGTADLRPYRDAIITKKLAAMAFYRFGMEWEELLAAAGDPVAVARKIVSV